MLLIGSRALAIRELGFNASKSDWDIVCLPEEKYLFDDLPDFEWHDPARLWNNDLEYFYKDGTVTLPNGVEVGLCSREGLAVIKRSHLWRDYQWDKHITHYHKYLRPHFPYGDTYYKIRLQETKTEFPQGNPSLNQTNEEFFDDAVKKVYDHDWLHELAAHYEKPLYTRLKRDDSKAWCERDLWDKLIYSDKLKCVAEECYVIGVERFLVPSNWTYSYRGAYLNALKKVCTTLTSGFFRSFAIDNYPEIIQTFYKDKLTQIKEKLQ